ncbi:hypothetical protein D3C80_1660400 [compost metagenome]
MKAFFERRGVSKTRPVQIALQAQTDAAHREAIAHQQHLLAGRDPELQVVALAHQRQHTRAGRRGQFELRIADIRHLGRGHVQFIRPHHRRLEVGQRGDHQRVTATQHQGRYQADANIQRSHDRTRP